MADNEQELIELLLEAKQQHDDEVEQMKQYLASVGETDEPRSTKYGLYLPDGRLV